MPTSTKPPGTAASVAWGSAVPWSTPSNAAASDDTYAAVTLGSLQWSEWLQLTNFDFASEVGGSDTVNGLAGALEWKVDNTGIVVPPPGDPVLPVGEVSIALVKGGVIQATSGPTTYPSDPTTTEGTVTFGGAAELWGGITISEALDSGFGVAIRVYNSLTKSRTCSIDLNTLSLAYTPSGGGGSTSGSGGGGGTDGGGGDGAIDFNCGCCLTCDVMLALIGDEIPFTVTQADPTFFKAAIIGYTGTLRRRTFWEDPANVTHPEFPGCTAIGYAFPDNPGWITGIPEEYRQVIFDPGIGPYIPSYALFAGQSCIDGNPETEPGVENDRKCVFVAFGARICPPAPTTNQWTCADDLAYPESSTLDQCTSCLCSDEPLEWEIEFSPYGAAVVPFLTIVATE